jgi:hypothetical protein
MKPGYFLKILSVLAVLLIVGLPVIAAETVSALAPAVQDSATLPPDSSPFMPDSPEKEKRVKKLLKQITATYGFSRGREELLPSWGPRIDKLYSLHKKLTENDWKLLAEMYVSFTNSDWEFIAGLPANFDNTSNDASNFDSAMQILLAMHGKASLETLDAMMAILHWSSISRQWTINQLKRTNELQPWSYSSEYKKDQQQSNK